MSGCVNDPYPVTWTYSDGTTETVNYSAQSNADVETMFEIVSKTVANKFITSVAIEYDDYVIIDDIYWTYDNQQEEAEEEAREEREREGERRS